MAADDLNSGNSLQALPKAELHCHLDGILDRAMLRDIRAGDPAFPIDPAEFERAYPVEGYDRFWKWWQFTGPLDGQLNAHLPILVHHVQRLKVYNVRYAEIMIASGELPRDAAMAIDAVRALRREIDRQEAGIIQIEFLVATGRNKPPERMAALEDLFLALHRAGLIVGIAIAGPEAGNPVRPFSNSLARFHEAGLGIEIHAGEWCGPESVWDALEYGFPDRIGHGVSVFQDERLIEAILERDVHLEMCPTSNLKTGSVEAIQAHPIRRARDLGLNFGVNTDDPGPFENNMLSEYRLLSQHCGFQAQDFEAMFHNAIRSRFQPNLRVSLPSTS
jgi:adenosine deaminase